MIASVLIFVTAFFLLGYTVCTMYYKYRAVFTSGVRYSNWRIEGNFAVDLLGIIMLLMIMGDQIMDGMDIWADCYLFFVPIFVLFYIWQGISKKNVRKEHLKMLLRRAARTNDLL